MRLQQIDALHLSPPAPPREPESHCNHGGSADHGPDRHVVLGSPLHSGVREARATDYDQTKPQSSHGRQGSDGVAALQGEQTRSICMRAVRSGTKAQNRTNAAWLRGEVERLRGWIDGAPHRWPVSRVSVALQAIVDGDSGWQLRAADALMGGGR